MSSGQILLRFLQLSGPLMVLVAVAQDSMMVMRRCMMGRMPSSSLGTYSHVSFSLFGVSMPKGEKSFY